MVDRLVVKPGIETRLADSIENVLEISEGLLNVDVDRRKRDPGFFQTAFPVLTAASVHTPHRAQKLFLQQSLRGLPHLRRTGIQDGI